MFLTFSEYGSASTMVTIVGVESAPSRGKEDILKAVGIRINNDVWPIRDEKILHKSQSYTIVKKLQKKDYFNLVARSLSEWLDLN